MAVLFEISCQRSFQLILIFFSLQLYKVVYGLLYLIIVVAVGFVVVVYFIGLKRGGKIHQFAHTLDDNFSICRFYNIYLLAHLVCQTESNHLLLIPSITCCCCFYFILNFLTILIIVDNQYGYHYFIYINIVAILNTI